MDRRNARRQRRQDMARRRTVAAQERMRLISQLARKEKKDDDFGMRDEDWDVYKAINKVKVLSFCCSSILMVKQEDKNINKIDKRI